MRKRDRVLWVATCWAATLALIGLMAALPVK